MHVETAVMSQAFSPKAERKDPSGFVMSMSLVLFTLTLVAVLAMHFASQFNWQVL